MQVYALILILAGWAFWAGVLIGLGCLLHKLLKGKNLQPGTEAAPPESLLGLFFLGLCGAGGLLQAWHLLAPVNLPAATGLTLIGAAGLVIGKRDVLSALRALPPLGRWAWVFVPLAAGGLLWIANRASGPNEGYDSGVYHIQYVLWAKQYAVVPGLGNLHCRLGHSNAVLLLAAAMDHLPLPGRANHLLYGMIVGAIFLAFARALVGLVRRGRPAAGEVFFTLLLYLLVEWCMRASNISSFSTDLAPGILILVATRRLMEFLRDLGSARPSHVRTGLRTLAAMAAALVCFKISALFFSAGLVLTAAGAALWAGRGPGREGVWGRPGSTGATAPGRLVLQIVLIGAAFVGPYLARNVIQTGYPLYPSGVLALDADWRMPDQRRDWQVRQIAHWAKAEQQGALLPPHVDGWLGGWVERFVERRGLMLLPAMLAVLAGTMALTLGPLARKDVPARMYLAAAPLLAALGPWLALAPEPRFGFPLLWALAACLTGVLAERNLQGLPPAIVRSAAVLWLAAVLGPVTVLTPLARMKESGKPYLHELSREMLLPPGSDAGFHPPPTCPYQWYTTRTGLKLAVPVLRNQRWVRVDIGQGMYFYAPNGEQETELYYVPLPSTPYPAPDLALRKAGDLGAGFRFVPPPPDAPDAPPPPRANDALRAGASSQPGGSPAPTAARP